MDVKLYNLEMNYNGQDRLYFPTVASRDLAFSASPVLKKASSFERVDSLTFTIEVFELISNLKFNYAIYNGYHCFIKSIIEKTENSSKMTLTLDVINQHLTGDKLDLAKDVFVKRTHIDRFIHVGGDDYRFNFDNDDLLIAEDINIQPSIYGDNNFAFSEQDLITTKWLTITRPVTVGTGGDPTFADFSFNQFKYLGDIKSDIIRMPNVTFYIPLFYDRVVFERENGTIIGECNVELIMNLATTSEILDVEVLPYNPTKSVKNIILIEDGANSYARIIIDDNHTEVMPGNGVVQKFDSTNANTWMLTNNIYGERCELEVCTANPNSDHFAHKDVIKIQDIASDENIEPKLFQFKKYDVSYMQNKFDAYFDQLKNDDLKLILQAGLNYGTNRYDFYLESGNYNNFKNTGSIITAISDQTISMNVNKWKDYIQEKKVTSSAGYAYGGQVVSGLLGASGQVLTGNTFGGVATAVSSVANIGATYATRQDLKQAPNQSKARGGNILNEFSYCETFQLTFSEVVPTESEQRFILNKLIYSGYLLNDYKNLFDIIDTRVNFNYIELVNQDTMLIENVSTDIQNEINRILNNGVRLYKSILKLNTKAKLNLERSLI